MTRRDWWLGLAMLAFVVLVHALVPRYEIRTATVGTTPVMMRVDRWTGTVELAGATRPAWLRSSLDR